MFGRKSKEQKRFYLLPGQGGSAYRRKQRRILLAGLAVGLLVSGIFVLVAYLVSRTP